MKAKLLKQNQGNIAPNRKEKHFIEEYAAIVALKKADYKGNKLQTIIRLRFYGTNAINYACIWINDGTKGIYSSGGGSAGGYGYHRTSAAAGHAIKDAGFKLSESIDGVGDTGIQEAVEAIAKSMGYRKVYIHKAHA